MVQGEHRPIVDRATFDRIQQLLASKSRGRKAKRFESGALLTGRLYDDKGNLMSPTYSSKNGVRYRFYVSSALLRGRKSAAGSVSRIAASEIESAVLAVLETYRPQNRSDGTPTVEMLERAVIARGQLLITIAGTINNEARTVSQEWSPKPKDSATEAPDIASRDETRNQGLTQSIVRAHAWLRFLGDGTYTSVEQLAQNIGLHPKVIRQALRLAFLTPRLTSAILEGRQPATLSLAQIPKVLPLSWTEQQRLLS